MEKENEREKIMRQWDSWVRHYRTAEECGSWPRDAFEALLDDLFERIEKNENQAVKKLRES